MQYAQAEVQRISRSNSQLGRLPLKSTLGDSQDFANLGAGAMDIENRQTDRSRCAGGFLTRSAISGISPKYLILVCFGRGSWIRTNDLQYPKLPRYQAALYPE
jgi:hypothetical protein